MKLFCPLLPQFLIGGTTCLLNQLFGENKNTQLYDPNGNLVGGYGPEGHTGLDMRTIGEYKYSRYNQRFNTVTGEWSGYWKKEERDPFEKVGFIPVLAAHSGQLTTNVFTREKQRGWGMFIDAGLQDDGYEYRTMYWHIESPWRSLGSWAKALFTQFKPSFVRQGSIIAIAGNTGMSTAPHLHWELQRRRPGGVWEPTDPVPYLADESIVYQKGEMGERRWWYKGKEINETESKKILNSLPHEYVG